MRYCVALVLLLSGCQEARRVADYVPPGMYRVEFQYGDEDGKTYGGGLSYTKEDDPDGALRLRRNEPAPPGIRLPQVVRLLDDVAPVASAGSR